MIRPYFSRFKCLSKLFWIWALFTGFFLVFSQAFADSIKPHEFPDFVAAHKQELSDLYDTFGSDFLGTVTMALLGFYGKFFLITFGISFAEDVGIAKGFSMIMTPTMQGITRAIVWAVIRLILVFLLLFATLASFAIMAKSIPIGIVLLIVAILLYLAISTVSTSMIYQAGLGLGLGITIAATLFELVINYFVVFPLENSYLAAGLQNVIRENVVIKIQSQTEELNGELKKAQGDLDAASQATQAIRDEIDLNRKKQADYQKALADRMVADDFVFMHIASLRASGKLPEAADAYKQFPTEFPKSPLVAAAAQDYDEIVKEMDEQKAALAKQQAEEAKEKAAKEKLLQAKMASGNATLSDMRNRLLGMTRDEVRKYLGAPDAEASDRWGYAKQILIDRLSGQHCGLAIEFFENHVRTVDYYNYGTPSNE